MYRAGGYFIVLVLIFLQLVSCSYQSGKEGAAATSRQQESEVQGTKKAEVVTFTMFCADKNDNYENFESPVAKEITKKTGIKLKMEYAGKDAQQRIALMIASGEYPDFVFAKENQVKFIEAGAFIRLDDLLEKYGSNLKKLYGKYFNKLRYSLKDRSIYYLGSYGVSGEKWKPQNGFELQHAVVKEMNFPEMRTLKDLEEALVKYKKLYPEIDGQPTIGLSLLAEGWKFSISVTNPAVFATGGPDDGEWYVDPKTLKAIYHYTRPAEKEYFRWLNHLNDTGLLDPESFVQTSDQYIDKIASGRVLALIDSDYDYSRGEDLLSQKKKFERMYGMYPLTLSRKYKNAEFQSGGYSGNWGIGITTSCKDPVKAMKFFNWIASEEGQITINWGVEGQHYTIENGLRVVKGDPLAMRSDPEFFKKSGISVYTHPFPLYGVGVKDSHGQYFSYGSKDTLLPKTAIEREVLTNYGAMYWADLFPSADQFAEKPWGDLWQLNLPSQSEVKQVLDVCSKITRERIPEAIMTKPQDFDKVWEQYMKEIESAGIHRAEDQLNQLIDERIRLWNK